MKETQSKVSHLITDLHRGKHINDMTTKCLSQTPNPPRIPEFYTLIKIHKPTITGTPIISGCDGPTERISPFVDSLLQPISKSLKDTTDFIIFIEHTKVKNRTFLVYHKTRALTQCAQHTTIFTRKTSLYLHIISGKCLDLSLKKMSVH